MQSILVVDDKASVRTLVCEYLTEEGFRSELGQGTTFTVELLI